MFLIARIYNESKVSKILGHVHFDLHFVLESKVSREYLVKTVDTFLSLRMRVQFLFFCFENRYFSFVEIFLLIVLFTSTFFFHFELFLSCRLVSSNGWPVINGTKCFPLFGTLPGTLKTPFTAHSVEKFLLYKTVDFVSQISFSCRRKIEKTDRYSNAQLRFSIFFFGHLSICVSLWSSSSMLNVKYLAAIDREFFALCVEDLFKAPR